MMRRMVKEELLKFDGTPLFPERRACSANYELSDPEAVLYVAVTDYVRNEMNRADKLDGKRRGRVGFALTLLQRRLASSPEAIYQSLKRRRKHLESRLEAMKTLARGHSVQNAGEVCKALHTSPPAHQTRRAVFPYPAFSQIHAFESFCEGPRFAGTCYQAANWTCVGQTKGRGKLDVHSLYALPIKDIWLRPLQSNWKIFLNL